MKGKGYGVMSELSILFPLFLGLEPFIHLFKKKNCKKNVEVTYNLVIQTVFTNLSQAW